eukprot:2669653-Amphidinium_carterae.1
MLKTLFPIHVVTKRVLTRRLSDEVGATVPPSTLAVRPGAVTSPNVFLKRRKQQHNKQHLNRDPLALKDESHVDDAGDTKYTTPENKRSMPDVHDVQAALLAK